MALREILEYPDQRLRTIAQPVAQVDDTIRTLVEDMFDTMYEARGIGLAASQINVHKQVIVIDLSAEHNEGIVLINPRFEIIEEALQTYDEGCLSVPGFYETIERPRKIRVYALDREGKEQTFEAQDLLAVCIQHEIDHLNGKLFVDYLSNLKRNRIRDKLVKMHKRQTKH